MSDPLPNPNRHLIRAARARLAILVAILRPWKALLRSKPWGKDWKPGQPTPWMDEATKGIAAAIAPNAYGYLPGDPYHLALHVTACHQLIDNWRNPDKPSHHAFKRQPTPYVFGRVVVAEGAVIEADAKELAKGGTVEAWCEMTKALGAKPATVAEIFAPIE